MLTIDLLDRNIAQCEAAVAAGNEDQSTLEFLVNLRQDLASASEADWQAYNELTEHLPQEGADQTLIILKGQLLLERLVRQFVRSRLPNKRAFHDDSFRFSQCIEIGESMCLPNKETEWMWRQIKDLSSIRNELAHNLIYANADARVKSFVAAVANYHNLKSRTLTSAMSVLYGMLKGLCDLSTRDPKFKAFEI